MAECDEYNRNSWFLLFSKQEEDWRYHVIHFTLFDKYNIYPSSEDLNQICRATNVSCWFWLSHYNHWHEFFALLINKNLFPSSTAMNAISTVDNTSAWFHLGKGGDGNASEVMEALFKKNIYPSYDALSATESSTQQNSWYSLIPYNQNSLLQILENGILPTYDDLCQVMVQQVGMHEEEEDDVIRVPLWFSIFFNLISMNQNQDSHGTNLVLDKNGIPRRDSIKEKILDIFLDNNLVPPLDVYQYFLYLTEQGKYGCFSTQILQKLTNRINCSEMLKTQYKAEDKAFISLFSRPDVNNFYGFVYLFYLTISMRKPDRKNDMSQETSFFIRELPFEILLKIAGYFPIPDPNLRSKNFAMDFVKVHFSSNHKALFFPAVIATETKNKAKLEENNQLQNKRKQETDHYDSENPKRKKQRTEEKNSSSDSDVMNIDNINDKNSTDEYIPKKPGL